MNRVAGRLLVRQIIRDNLPSTDYDEGDWSDTQLNRYLELGQDYAYEKQIEFVKTSYLTDKEVTGTGEELLEPPPNFKRVYQILTEQEGVPYRLISLEHRHEYNNYTDNGYAYYIQDDKIGILPELDTDETCLIYYYRKYRPMDEDATTDLHDYSARVACIYAALLALIDRGDVQTELVRAELARWEAMIPNERKQSRMPYPIIKQQRFTRTLPYNWKTT